MYGTKVRVYFGTASGIGTVFSCPRQCQYTKKSRSTPYFRRHVAAPVCGTSRNPFTSVEVIARRELLPQRRENARSATAGLSNFWPVAFRCNTYLSTAAASFIADLPDRSPPRGAVVAGEPLYI